MCRKGRRLHRVRATKCTDAIVDQEEYMVETLFQSLETSGLLPGFLASRPASDSEYPHSIPWTAISALALASATLWLYLRLYHPVVNPFPWSMSPTPEGRAADRKCKVVLAGSFTPPHRGHLAMLEHLSRRYGDVIAVVGMNSSKSYDVTPQQRADLLRAMVDDEGNGTKGKVRVEIVEGYIWKFAMAKGVSIMFRGIRTWEKDGVEERHLQLLNTWGPMMYGPLRWPLPTQFLEGKPEYNHISSTLIRDICKGKGGKLSGKNRSELLALVPDVAADRIATAYS